MMDYTDETLMAYADGELDAETAAQIAATIVADTALAARVAVFSRSRIAVKTDYPAAPPAPDALIAQVRRLAAAQTAPAPSNVITLADRRKVPLWAVPLAASIALALGLSAGLLRPVPDAGTLVAAGILQDPGLAVALATVPSGSSAPLPGGAEITPIASFQTENQEFCREFEYRQPLGGTIVSVACQNGQDWDGRLAIAASGGTEGYAPAASLDTLDAWLSGVGAQAPMSAQDEAVALSDPS